jgi:hypothetical protein
MSSGRANVAARNVGLCCEISYVSTVKKTNISEIPQKFGNPLRTFVDGVGILWPVLTCDLVPATLPDPHGGGVNETIAMFRGGVTFVSFQPNFHKRFFLEILNVENIEENRN